MRRVGLCAALVGATACGSGGPAAQPPLDGAAADAVAADASVPDALVPDAMEADAAVPVVPPEVDGRIVINEVMASNAFTVEDDTGAPSDWIELYNPTDQDIPLHGYSLTDDLSVPDRSVLGVGVVVPAGGHLVLWADASANAGPLHLGFTLAKSAGTVGLARPDATWIDRVQYTDQASDLSAAREPDGSDRWTIEWNPTPGAADEAGDGQPVGAEDPAQPPEAIPPAGDLSDQLLGFDRMPAFSVDIAPADMAALRLDPRTYVHASLTYDGRTFAPVGVHIKGGSTFQPIDSKPSLKISMDEYVPDGALLGVKSLTLNNMWTDQSMVHERLAYLFARTASLPASRANHALLTVNGQFYGLYAQIETMKKSLIARWFSDASGPLYEQFDVDYLPADVDAFQLESGVDDRTLLAGLAQALTLADPDLAIAQASQYADLGEFQRFWAMLTVIGQYDSFPYSIPGDDVHLYADPTSHKLVWLPWGMDETFQDALRDPTATTYSVFATRCKASPACYRGYVDQVWELLDLKDAMNLESVRRQVIAEVAPYVALDQRKPYTSVNTQNRPVVDT